MMQYQTWPSWQHVHAAVMTAQQLKVSLLSLSCRVLKSCMGCLVVHGQVLLCAGLQAGERAAGHTVQVLQAAECCGESCTAGVVNRSCDASTRTQQPCAAAMTHLPCLSTLLLKHQPVLTRSSDAGHDACRLTSAVHWTPLQLL